MLIPSRRSRRKPDPFILLFAFVALGMFVTLGYQVMLYSDASDHQIATQAPRATDVGG